jgi:hypothetical protein
VDGQPLDRAFFKPAPGLFFAARELLSGSRLTKIAARLAATSDPAVLEREAAQLFGFRTGSQGAAALGKRLAKAVETFDFAEEAAATGAAVDFALGVKPPPPGSRAPRFLQGQVFELGEGAKYRAAGQSLQAGAAHRLSVRIGPPEAGWLNPVDGTAFPEEKLPPETGGHRLQVVFAEPEHVPQPQVGWIHLPAGDGPSTACSFYFHTRSDSQAFEARITVLHRGRVLQTALLRAPISPDPDQEIPGEPLVLVIEEVVRPEAAGLEGRQAFDAALVVNHSREGTGQLTAVSPEAAALVSLQDVQPVADDIRRKLEEIAHDPARFPKKLQAPATVDLLRYLARKGSSLYRLVVLDQLAGSALATARRIQVVSATPEAFLPVEFMYELPPPDREAGLCPNARQALKKGACPGCTAAQASPSPVVCPLGFWGLSRVIERHAYQKSKRDELSLSPSEFALLAEPAEGRRELPVLASAVLAASQRVDASGGGQIAKVLQALDRATGQKAVLVEGWSQWVEAVQSRRPSLLVLLPHTLEDEELDEPALEISREQRLLSGDIRAEHVLAVPDPAPPVVLLIGCETLTKGEELQGFIAQFRRSGAAVVLGTVATVLGRHAAPVAAEVANLLARLTKTQGGISFGDLMLALRREALSDGIPMVLGLFAYGDADWQLV